MTLFQDMQVHSQQGLNLVFLLQLPTVLPKITNLVAQQTFWLPNN